MESILLVEFESIKMQYIIQIGLFSVLVLLVLLRFDIAKIKRFEKTCQLKLDLFMRTVDIAFVALGGDVSELGYRSRMLLNCISNSAEAIAAIHIISGSAYSGIGTISEKDSSFEHEINHAAGNAIAAFHQMERVKENASKRWRNLLGKPTMLSPKHIAISKSIILTKFSEHYQTDFAKNI